MRRLKEEPDSGRETIGALAEKTNQSGCKCDWALSTGQPQKSLRHCRKPTLLPRRGWNPPGKDTWYGGTVSEAPMPLPPRATPTGQEVVLGRP